MIKAEKKPIIELRQEMNRIRRLGGPVVTNYFNQCSQCTEPLSCWIGNGALAFGWLDINILRIYFYAIDIEELVHILAMTPSDSCIDYLTKEREENTGLFEKAGYELLSEYGRYMIKTKEEKTETELKATQLRKTLVVDDTIQAELYHAGYGELAMEEDAEEIDRMLREKFDARDSHFYDMETLREHIHKGWVFVARENDKIIAANLIEIQGRKCYWAYSFNDGPVEVFTSLITFSIESMARLGYKHNYCWMDLKNKRAIRFNILYNGYKFDDMYDRIYIKSSKSAVNK